MKIVYCFQTCIQISTLIMQLHFFVFPNYSLIMSLDWLGVYSFYKPQLIRGKDYTSVQQLIVLIVKCLTELWKSDQVDWGRRKRETKVWGRRERGKNSSTICNWVAGSY